MSWLWSLDLVQTAASSCAGSYWGIAAAFAAVSTASVYLRGDFPKHTPLMRVVPWILLMLAAALALALRDPHLLLGDGRVWARHLEVYGGGLPPFHSPLSHWLLGNTWELFGARDPEVFLAASSTAAGVAVVLALWLIFPRRAQSLDLALVWCLPFSFVFISSVETTGPFFALLAMFLAFLGRDLNRQRVGPGTVLSFLCLVLADYTAAFLAVPLLSFWAGRRVNSWLVLVALCAAGSGVAAALEPARGYSLWHHAWGPTRFTDYLLDVANGWILLFVPLGGLVVWMRREIMSSAAGRFYVLAGFAFALLPLMLLVRRGLYTDLDPLAPAFICWVFAAAVGLRQVRWGRSVLWAPLASGVVILAGILALRVCPAGAELFEEQLGRRAADPSMRAYGYEVLAYYQRDQGEVGGAIASIDHALELTPGNIRLYGPRGRFLLARGDTTSAISSLYRTLETTRAFSHAALLSELLFARGRTQEAVNVLRPLMPDVFSSPEAALAASKAYLRLGHADSALSVSLTRLRMEPRDAWAHYSAGAAAIQMNDYETAVEALHSAALLQPRNVFFQVQYINLLDRRLENAIRAKEYLESLEPDVRDAVLPQVREIYGRGSG